MNAVQLKICVDDVCKYLELALRQVRVTEGL